MRRSGSRLRAVATTWPNSERPRIWCRTLGVADRIRVPSPAASTTTAAGRGGLTREVLLGRTVAVAGGKRRYSEDRCWQPHDGCATRRAPGGGFEPPFSRSKRLVLPLDDPGKGSVIV